MSSIQKTRYPADQVGQLTGKFAHVEPAQFGSTMDDLWQSAQAIRDAVIDQVETGRITSVQGVAVVAGVTGTLFGYQEFHRELRPSDLALSLIGQGNGSQG